VQALQRIREDFEGPWDEHLAWLDGELNRLWKMRGAYPGLGAALTAFGVHQGNLLAHQIALSLSDHAGGWQANPWDYLDTCVAGQRADPAVAKQLTQDKVGLWRAMTTKFPKRRALLELLSRFALSNAQASRFYEPAERTKRGIAATDDDLLANPYRLYELDRAQPDPVALRVIDRGLWPDTAVREQFPFPEPSALTGDLDDRRVRALVIEWLEVAARQGHSVLPRSQVIQEIRDLNVQPPCLVGEDVMTLAEEGFGDEVKMVPIGDESQGYQLGRLARVGDLIRNMVQRRVQGKRYESNVDWRALLDAEFGPIPQAVALQEREEQARSEKAAALAEVYAARISVLVGPAGTGKTTVLKTLVGRPEVKHNGLLLLAPTGKARVRLEQQTGVLGAQTIAQFLVGSGRYDPRTGIYRMMPGARKDDSARTIVIDEASMLTEEQLAAVIDAVYPPDRFIRLYRE
jgi:hypothetical protein